MISLGRIEQVGEEIAGWLERHNTDKRTKADERFAETLLKLLRVRIQPGISTPEAQDCFAALGDMIAANSPPSQPAASPVDPDTPSDVAYPGDHGGSMYQGQEVTK